MLAMGKVPMSAPDVLASLPGLALDFRPSCSRLMI